MEKECLGIEGRHACMCTSLADSRGRTKIITHRAIDIAARNPTIQAGIRTGRVAARRPILSARSIEWPPRCPRVHVIEPQSIDRIDRGRTWAGSRHGTTASSCVRRRPLLGYGYYCVSYGLVPQSPPSIQPSQSTPSSNVSQCHQQKDRKMLLTGAAAAAARAGALPLVGKRVSAAAAAAAAASYGAARAAGATHPLLLPLRALSTALPKQQRKGAS